MVLDQWTIVLSKLSYIDNVCLFIWLCVFATGEGRVPGRMSVENRQSDKGVCPVFNKEPIGGQLYRDPFPAGHRTQQRVRAAGGRVHC